MRTMVFGFHNLAIKSAALAVLVGACSNAKVTTRSGNNEKSSSAEKMSWSLSNSFTNQESVDVTVDSGSDSVTICDLFFQMQVSVEQPKSEWVKCVDKRKQSWKVKIHQGTALASKALDLRLWTKLINGEVQKSESAKRLVYDVSKPDFIVDTLSTTTFGAQQTLAFNYRFKDEGSGFERIDVYLGPTTNTPEANVKVEVARILWITPRESMTDLTLRIVAKDRAGNTSESLIGPLVIDATPAEVVSASFAVTHTANSSVTINVSDCKNASEISIGEVSVAASNNWQTCAVGNINYSLLGTSDGSKSIFIWSKTALGNPANAPLGLSVILDSTPPSLSIDTPSPVNLASTVTAVSISGTCSEDGTNVDITDPISSSSTCSGGAWSASLNLSGVSDGQAVTIRVTQYDNAGNEGVATTSFVKDLIAPTVVLSTSSQTRNIANDSNTLTLAGTCSDAGGTVAIVIDNVVSNSVATCSSGSWSTTINPQSLGQGSFIAKARHIDLAANSADSGTITILRDITAPNAATNLTWTQGTFYNSLTATTSWTATSSTDVASYTIQLYQDAGCSSTAGSPVTEITATTQSVTVGAEGTYAYRLTVVDQANNTTQGSCSAAITLDTTRPTVNTFSLDAGSGTTTDRIVAVSLAATDAGPGGGTFVSEFCLKTNPGSAPSSSDSCWISLSAPSPGISLSNSISFSGFDYVLSFAPGVYTVKAWVKDRAGNISQLSNSQSGTSGTDIQASTFSQTAPPTVSLVFATNTATPSNPPTPAELTVTSGDPVYIHWRAEDGTALASNPITLEYTTNQVDYTQIATGLANGSNSGCSVDNAGTTLDDQATGCYVLAAAPTSGIFRVAVSALNSGGQIARAESSLLNSNSMRIVAGNLNLGFGGPATATVFSPQGYEFDAGQSLAVHPDGRIFVLDGKGLIMISPQDGLSNMILKNAGNENTTGVPLASAAMDYGRRIVMEYSGNLLVFDQTRIRRIITSTNPMTIEHVIGGGNSITDGTSAANFEIPHGTGAKSSLHPAPNGDIYFIINVEEKFVNNAGIWRYEAATGLMRKLTLPATLSLFGTTQTTAECKLTQIGLIANPGTQEVEKLVVMLRPDGETEGIGYCGQLGGYAWSWTEAAATIVLNASTMAFHAQTPALRLSPPYGDGYRDVYFRFANSLNGQLYAVSSYNDKRTIRYNATTNTWTQVLGNNYTGFCVDGTAVLSCSSRTKSVFVSANESIYYFDQGLIRVRDLSGNVLTIAGQYPSYGDGGPAIDARFGDLRGLAIWRDSGTPKIVAIDAGQLKIREFSIGGNIQTVAGNGSYESPNATTLAINQGIDTGREGSTSGIEVDPTTGNIWYRQSDQYVGKLTRSTGLWSTFGSWYPGYGARILGLNATKLLVTVVQDYISLAPSVNIFVGEMDLSTEATTHIMAPTSGVNNPYYGSGICADGSPAIDCRSKYISDDYTTKAHWDSHSSKWVTLWRGSNIVMRYSVGGNIEHFITLPRAAYGFAYKRNADLSVHQVFYSGVNGKVYRYNVNTAVETDISTDYFSGLIAPLTADLIYDSTRGSLFTIGNFGSISAVIELLNQ